VANRRAPIQRSRNSALRGKTALVTGASRGIGLAIAKALAAQGCNVVIAGRNSATLKGAARHLARGRARIVPMVCDVRKPDEIQALAAEIRRQFRRLDILVNNAGVSHASLPVAKLPLERWREVLETNLTGMFLVTQAALPLMQRGGAIINNLSIAAKRTFPGGSAYVASKHGGLGFTKTLREELRPQGIRVIALLPGAADTSIWDAFWPDAPREKMMSAETVAQAVVNAVLLPDHSTLEELTIMPSVGVL